MKKVLSIFVSYILLFSMTYTPLFADKDDALATAYNNTTGLCAFRVLSDGSITASGTNTFSGTTNMTGAANLSGTVTISGTPSISGSSFTVGTSTFVVKAGNVGIGVTSPAQALDMVGNIKVSSSTSSTASQYFGGAFSSLPSTGYSEGTMIYNTTDHKMYISTQAVSGSTQSWKNMY